MLGTSLSIAIAQSDVTSDVRLNGAHIRELMYDAARKGCRLIHFPEAALSGYIKAQIKSWSDVNWGDIDEELAEIKKLAALLKIWVAVGCNHRAIEYSRPHNSLYIISDQGEVVTRYDKRLCSNEEVSNWYTPGLKPRTFAIDGIKFGCAICIEVNFPEIFLEYERLGVDCVLLSAYSDETIYAILSRAHAATNCFWISYTVPAMCSSTQSSMMAGPDGSVLIECGKHAGIAVVQIAKDNPQFDTALNKARSWRRTARLGDIYKVS